MFNGNLTKDIELRSTQTGKSVASFSIAVNEGKDQTTFVDCVAWDKTAELMEQYTQKGDRLCIVGRLQKRSYDKDGQKIWVTEIVVDRWDFPPKRAEATVEKSSDVGMTGNMPSASEDLADEIPF